MKLSFSNAVLKNIAYMTMLIDHFFAIVFWALLVERAAYGFRTDRSYIIYGAGRAIGRIAFVLFAYLAVEGFMYTRDRKKYLLRMGIFALVSEIPFDLAFNGNWYAFKGQNVYFTLFLGVLALMLLERWRGHKVLQAIALLSCCLLAALLKTDYMFMGVLLIAVFYLFRDNFKMQAILGGVTLYVGIVAVYIVRNIGSGRPVTYFMKSGLSEMYGLAAFALLAFYNGERGRRLPKLLCYLFYPVHLLLLCLLRYQIFG